ncbi:MAG: nucleotide-diphospho-sugar transferase [Bacteroidales bacterium]|nr:nucleotide-diphospho-sugar transferase [Bacteroidales bacterium]
MNQLDVPILFVIFNRMDTAEKVFETIRQAQPKKLYIAADGPRKNKEGEYEKCLKVRGLADRIDWNCEVKTLFREHNLGCGKAVSGAIDWLFQNEEKGIILEDDCLPHPDFFPYCKELLEKYRDEDKVKIISGNNFQDGIQRGDASYYFSAYSHIWGWASWRRAWQNYDLYLENYSLKDFMRDIKPYFSSYNERQVWKDRFLVMKKRGNNTWDYQWNFHIWKQHGLCIIPNVNLISNIGFGLDSTHTDNAEDKNSNMQTKGIMPLIHPAAIEQNRQADEYFRRQNNHKSVIQLLWRTFRRTFLVKPAFDK